MFSFAGVASEEDEVYSALSPDRFLELEGFWDRQTPRLDGW